MVHQQSAALEPERVPTLPRLSLPVAEVEAIERQGRSARARFEIDRAWDQHREAMRLEEERREAQARRENSILRLLGSS
jgi:hypothetical protein